MTSNMNQGDLAILEHAARTLINLRERRENASIVAEDTAALPDDFNEDDIVEPEEKEVQRPTIVQNNEGVPPVPAISALNLFSLFALAQKHVDQEAMNIFMNLVSKLVNQTVTRNEWVPAARFALSKLPESYMQGWPLQDPQKMDQLLHYIIDLMFQTFYSPFCVGWLFVHLILETFCVPYPFIMFIATLYLLMGLFLSCRIRHPTLKQQLFIWTPLPIDIDYTIELGGSQEDQDVDPLEDELVPPNPNLSALIPLSFAFYALSLFYIHQHGPTPLFWLCMPLVIYGTRYFPHLYSWFLSYLIVSSMNPVDQLMSMNLAEAYLLVFLLPFVQLVTLPEEKVVKFTAILALFAALCLSTVNIGPFLLTFSAFWSAFILLCCTEHRYWTHFEYVDRLLQPNFFEKIFGTSFLILRRLDYMDFSFLLVTLLFCPPTLVNVTSGLTWFMFIVYFSEIIVTSYLAYDRTLEQIMPPQPEQRPAPRRHTIQFYFSKSSVLWFAKCGVLAISFGIAAYLPQLFGVVLCASTFISQYYLAKMWPQL